mgnify:CR=1 FL=1
MALDLPLPKQVFGHPWLLQGGDKMSKSKGNVIYADDMVRLFGVDATRYFVLHEMPFENDGVITWELVIERFNSDLANILGNLVNRTISMSNKYFDGVVGDNSLYEQVDADLINTAKNLYKIVDEKMNELRISDAIDAIFELLRKCNKYIDDTTPWILAKDEAKKGRLNTVLYNLLECIRISAILLEPFIPSTKEKIFAQLNTDVDFYDSVKEYGGLKKGTILNDPTPLFARIETTK